MEALLGLGDVAVVQGVAMVFCCQRVRKSIDCNSRETNNVDVRYYAKRGRPPRLYTMAVLFVVQGDESLWREWP